MHSDERAELARFRAWSAGAVPASQSYISGQAFVESLRSDKGMPSRAPRFNGNTHSGNQAVEHVEDQLRAYMRIAPAAQSAGSKEADTSTAAARRAGSEQADRSMLPMPAAADSSSSSTRLIRLLIIEDDPMQQTVLRALFDKANGANAAERFELTFASLALQGLQLLRDRKNAFDLIILDNELPDMKGSDLVPLINSLVGANAQGREPPQVIMLSMSREPSDVEHSLQAGAGAYLTKPLAYEDVTKIAKYTRREASSKSARVASGAARSERSIPRCREKRYATTAQAE